ncbi:MAG: EamA family transporter RarD [Maricaulaceae bacterium]|nr:EamA family transporter RarD [Maricaulaceae bacterium]
MRGLAPEPPLHRPPAPQSLQAGMAALSGYVIWGLSPLFYKLLGFASAAEIVLHRAVWSVPVLALVLWLGAKWPAARAALQSPKAMLLLALSAALIASNWWAFIYAVNTGQVMEVSLGYFINPFMNVAVGLLLFRERLGPWRIAAIALAGAGVINQVVAVGQLPWLALYLAASFTVYGYVRKTIAVDGRAGMFWETAMIAVPSLAALGFLTGGGGGHFFDGPWPALLLILAGPMTVAPLLLFVIGARGLHFSTLGLLQFAAPTLQFAVAVIYGEPFTAAHAVTFGLIWAGVGCFVISLIRQRRNIPPRPVQGPAQ